MINNLSTPLSELQINSDVLQIDTENSATGVDSKQMVTEESVKKGHPESVSGCLSVF